jgi:hypothetical protein
VSAPAMTLALEVLSTMLRHQVKFTALSLLFLGVIATGLGWLSRSLAIGDELYPESPTPQPPIAAKTEGAASRLPRGRMTVGGRVLGPQGKPVPGASVMVYGASRQGGDILRASSTSPAALGQAICDVSGRFRLEMPRISSATHHTVAAAALAPGYGVGWVDLDVDADLPAAEITLRPEQVIEGRLFDISGQLAQGVRVSVAGMGHSARGPESLPDGLEGGPQFWGGNGANAPPAWPKPAITAADGRFTIRGIGRGLRVLLLALSPRFAQQRITVDMDAAAETMSITGVMEPAKVIIGRVTLADTGKPVPHAAISIRAYRGGPAYPSDYETDAEGNFRANPLSTDKYAVSVQAPPGQPYLSAASGIFDWIKGTFERRIDFVLHRGVVLRGKVVESGSGRPVEGAALGYVIRDSERGVPMTRAHTGPDGTYQFAVLPKAGMLAIMGPSNDYIFQEMADKMLREGRPGGQRQYAHAFVSCDLKPGTESREINVVLHRGATVKARVTTPDGQPVVRAWIFSRLLLRPQPWPTLRYSGEFRGDVRNGHSELHGLPPEAEVPVYFLDSKNQLGATTTFSVKAATEGPIPVPLVPCGLATARLVDRKGIPIAAYRDSYLISMIVTPGRDVLSKGAAEQDLPSSDGDYLSRIDPDHYNNLISDAQGRVTFPDLIPGATYRINDMTTVDEPGGRKTRSVFIARTGESIELGDIVIEKPQER